MSGYTKLFSEIVESTIWQEPNDMRVLWITLLALKDKDHMCTATIPYLAKVCNITVEQCLDFMEKFQQPDKYSRNQSNEGRRIERRKEGWYILNGEHYRQKMSEEVRKEQIRKAQERYRMKHYSNPVKKAPKGEPHTDTRRVRIPDREDESF